MKVKGLYSCRHFFAAGTSRGSDKASCPAQALTLTPGCARLCASVPSPLRSSTTCLQGVPGRACPALFRVAPTPASWHQCDLTVLCCAPLSGGKGLDTCAPRTSGALTCSCLRRCTAAPAAPSRLHGRPCSGRCLARRSRETPAATVMQWAEREASFECRSRRPCLASLRGGHAKAPTCCAVVHGYPWCGWCGAHLQLPAPKGGEGERAPAGHELSCQGQCERARLGARLLPLPVKALQA